MNYIIVKTSKTLSEYTGNSCGAHKTCFYVFQNNISSEKSKFTRTNHIIVETSKPFSELTGDGYGAHKTSFYVFEYIYFSK